MKKWEKLYFSPAFDGFNREEDDADDCFAFNKRTAVKLKTGFLCPQCEKSVLAYRQPRKCEDHE